MLRKKLINVSEQSTKSNKKQKSMDSLPSPAIQENVEMITSKYFTNNPVPGPGESSNPEPIWQQLYQIELKLNESIQSLKFKSPVAAVYNPIDYAAELHCAYLEKFLTIPLSVLFIGMNPGPWGMCQTGVPFGYIPAVRDWMQLTGNVNKPLNELPDRPVTGLLCQKSEQSGQRFWGLFEELCGPLAKQFFANSFVHNFCPLACFNNNGRNITPAELKGDEKQQLQIACLEATASAVNLLSPKIIISIGRYTEDRINSLFKSNQINSNILHKCMPHPSPRSLNNTNWNEKAKIWLQDNDIIKYLQPSLPPDC